MTTKSKAAASLKHSLEALDALVARGTARSSDVGVARKCVDCVGDSFAGTRPPDW